MKETINTEDCWHYAGYITGDGYGRASLPGKIRAAAHRLSYELHKGPIPEGLVIDHLCRVRCCINPNHLEAVTNSENVKRGVHPGRPKTHCSKGHALEGENIKMRGGWKQCLTCQRAYEKKYKHRVRAK